LPAEIDEVLAGGENLSRAIERVAQLDAQLLLLRSALESMVSRICTDIKEQFETWCQRRLDAVELDYLLWDGS
jgi:transposase-like protein